MTDQHKTMQTLPDNSSPAKLLTAELSCFEEAARYALLQRLVPAIRHHMVGEFHSMGMIAAMMDRRLQSPEPNLVSLRENCALFSSLSRTAASSCIDLMTWITPKSTATVKFEAGVIECLGLLSTEFRFKGFVIVNEVSELHAEVSSSALRSVLTSTLIALSDLLESPADLMIRAKAMPNSVELLIDVHGAEGREKNALSAEYRILQWKEVEILAQAESVNLTFSNGCAQITFTRTDSDTPIINVSSELSSLESVSL